MRSRLVKQIIICCFIVIICGVVVFLVRGYFLDSDNNKFNVTNELKEKYEYNEFQVINVTTEMLIQRYFIDFKSKLLTSPKEAYDLLSRESKKEFDNYTSFLEFINNNIEQIRTSTIEKYTIQNFDSSQRYIVLDQYNNKYTFTAKAILVYEVTLDFNNEITSIFE